MRRLLVTVLVLGVLAVGADRFAANQAESLIARQVEQEIGQRPAVHVRGTPFLTQFADGSYDGVDLTADDVQRAGIRVERLEVRLRGLTLPPGDVLGGQVDEVPAERADAVALISYAELTSRVADRGLSVSPAGDGRIRVTGRVEVLGRTVEASAVSIARVEGDDVVVTAESYETGLDIANELLTGAIGGRFDFTFSLGDLPFGARLTGLLAGPEGVRASATARDVVLR